MSVTPDVAMMIRNGLSPEVATRIHFASVKASKIGMVSLRVDDGKTLTIYFWNTQRPEAEARRPHDLMRASLPWPDDDKPDITLSGPADETMLEFELLMSQEGAR